MQEKLSRNAQAVLDIVRTADTHLTVQDVYEEVKRMRPKIGLATVYRNLHQLVAQGAIKEIEVGGGEACLYDGQGSLHGHFVCTQCRMVFDVPIEAPHAQVLEGAVQATGLGLRMRNVQLYGLCDQCQQKNDE